MNKLGRASFENEHTSWRFQSEHLSDQEITDEIADFFANISNDFTPVDPSLLHLPPPGAAFVSEVPCLPTEEEVYKLHTASKKTASVPKDFPITFLKEFLPFLAKPALMIFYNAISTGKYLSRWKTEYKTPIPKVPRFPKIFHLF